MSEFEFQYALQALNGVAEAMDAAGVDGGVPSHCDAADSDDWGDGYDGSEGRQ